MKLKKIQEGKIEFWIPSEDKYKAPVFYNPEGEFVRDISISVIKTFQKDFGKRITILDALSGTGVRGLRYAKEITNVKKVFLNDKNPVAVKLIEKNVKTNRLSKKCEITNLDANVLMHKKVFNVIDLDPFGSPNIFLDSASRSIYHKGLLAVTATDQAPLCGTYPLTCLKKYGIVSMKTDYYAEIGVRILISNIILSLAKREKAFIPLLIHSTKHYFRIFGKIEHLGKVRGLIKDFGYVMDCSCGNREYGKIKEKCFCGKKFKICGSIYLGKIIDKEFCKKVLKDLEKRDFRLKKDEEKLMKLLIEEAEMPPFYYDLHYLAKTLKVKIPKIENLIKELRSKGFKASRAHFCPTAIKTDASFKKLKLILR